MQMTLQVEESYSAGRPHIPAKTVCGPRCSQLAFFLAWPLASSPGALGLH